MEESFPLPLRPLIEKSATEPDSLPIRIAQINGQRGSFRNVTETSLQEEIHAERARNAAGVEGEEEEEEAVESQEAKSADRLEQLFKSRAEIVDFVTQAHAEANYALDLVSLLVSRYTPRQAEMSMSPYLKQRAPLGSLGIDIIKTPEQTEAVQKEIADLSRGWKMENFDSAANKLLQSASRLEEEVTAETKYWAGVLNIKEKGWKVCRLPRERQTLGVQYGFLEATPTFRDRGLAALRRGNRGDLILDRGLQARKPRSLRVRVQHAGRIVGASKIVPLELAPGNDAIENHIRLTRDALYEEELFHELNREAPPLYCTCIESKENLIQLQLTLSTNSNRYDKQGHAEDALAETVAQSLRILLSHAHRQKYRCRTQMPPPVTSKRRANPEYSLLRPIVCYLQHKSALEWLKLSLSNITRTLQLAGLNCKYNISPLVSVKFPLVDASNPSPWELDTPPFVERLVNSFLTPFESIVTGTFLSPASSFKILIVTNISPSAFGTEFEIGSNISSSPRTKSSSSRFGLRDDLQQLLLHLFTTDLVYLIPNLARDAGTEPSSLRPNTSLLKQEQGQEQEQPEQSGFNTPTPRHTSHLTSWIPTSPENGELTVFSPSQRRHKKLTIDLHPDKLTVRCQWLRSEIDVDGNMDWEMSTGEGDVIYWWGDGGGNEGMTLQSIVGLMSQEAVKAEL
ncbi:RNA polymerase II mediator complex component SRB4 [Histoplasma capsulatum H143]|uniref:Mediator of RNA polymerase II transcription subunit 17 n=1 Tax=Ajellomyces capsulatus (strain H143) TaxID=544712 RepID=C6H5I0_AJECH|nr:RNA polymerase II mediator complex component SRB4 [Histoplasma capsulatum H143]